MREIEWINDRLAVQWNKPDAERDEKLVKELTQQKETAFDKLPSGVGK